MPRPSHTKIKKVKADVTIDIFLKRQIDLEPLAQAKSIQHLK